MQKKATTKNGSNDNYKWETDHVQWEFRRGKVTSCGGYPALFHEPPLFIIFLVPSPLSPFGASICQMDVLSAASAAALGQWALVADAKGRADMCHCV